LSVQNSDLAKFCNLKCHFEVKGQGQQTLQS